jgi:hypothetical protein
MAKVNFKNVYLNLFCERDQLHNNHIQDVEDKDTLSLVNLVKRELQSKGKHPKEDGQNPPFNHDVEFGDTDYVNPDYVSFNDDGAQRLKVAGQNKKK